MRKWEPRKRKLIFRLGIVVAFLMLAYYGLRLLSDGLTNPSYKLYVEKVYLPAYKRSTSKWPQDLNGLPQYYYAHPQAADIAGYHRRNYQGFEIIRATEKSCVYKLFLSSGVFEGKAVLEAR